MTDRITVTIDPDLILAAGYSPTALLDAYEAGVEPPKETP